MLRVFTAMGKQMPKDKAIIEDTERVAQLLAKYNCTMIQGGAKMGLMGVVVKEFQKYSDEVVMIVPEAYKSDIVGVENKEFYIVEGESDRMRITIHTCDMMVVLPGGSGTLAELAYYNETKKSGEHKGRVVVINTNGYYNKLFKFYKHQVKKGFMKDEDIKFDVIKNADELEKIIQEVITEKQQLLQEENAKKAKAEKENLKKQKVEKATKEVKKEKTEKPLKVEQSKKEVAVKTKEKKVAKEVKPEPKKVEKVKPEAKKVNKNAKEVKPAKVVKEKVEEAKEVKKQTPKAKKVAEVNKQEVKPETKKAEVTKKVVAKPVKKVEAKSTAKKVEAKEVEKKANAVKKAPAKKVEKKTNDTKKTPAKKVETKTTPAKKPAAKTSAKSSKK